MFPSDPLKRSALAVLLGSVLILPATATAQRRAGSHGRRLSAHRGATGLRGGGIRRAGGSRQHIRGFRGRSGRHGRRLGITSGHGRRLGRRASHFGRSSRISTFGFGGRHRNSIHFSVGGLHHGGLHHLGSYGHCAPAYFYPSYGYYGAYGYGSLGGYLWRGPTYTVGYDYWAPVAPYEGSRDTEHARGDTRSRARRDLATLQARALRAFNARRAAESGGSGPKVVTPPKPEDGKRARQIGVALGRGDKAFEAGRYREAREEYVGALVLAGDDASVRIALGLAEYALGAYADASQAIRRGVAASPRLAASGFDLKQVYGREADFEAHRTALVNFVEQHPADLEARFLLGFVHYFSGQRPAALESFEGYTASPAHDPTVEPFIGLARASKRQPDTGKED